MRSCVLCLVLVTSVSLLAEEPTEHVLPPPGSWVTYQVTQPEIEKLHPGALTEMFLTVRLMGKEKYQGELCRWIEFDWETRGSLKRQRQAKRFLIPEKSLLENKSALFDIKTAFHAESTMKNAGRQNSIPLTNIVQQELTEKYFEGLEEDDYVELLFFPPFQQTLTKKEFPQEIETARSTLRCQTCLSGTDKETVIVDDPDRELDRYEKQVKMTLFQHPDVPFGIAGANFEYWEFGWTKSTNEKSGGKSLPDVHWRVHDYGTDARSPFKGRRPEPNQE